ncbi:MAG: hypothetical protein AAGE37_02965 [Pseudomonadota bacterium]
MGETAQVGGVKQSTFAIPTILAALTLFGLILALIYDGFWHVPAWFAISVPIIVISRMLLKTRNDR